MDQYEDYGDCPLASVWWEDYEEDIEDVSDFEWDISYQQDGVNETIINSECKK